MDNPVGAGLPAIAVVQALLIMRLFAFEQMTAIAGKPAPTVMVVVQVLVIVRIFAFGQGACVVDNPVGAGLPAIAVAQALVIMRLFAFEQVTPSPASRLLR